MVVKNKEGAGRGGLFEKKRFGIHDVYAIFDKSEQVTFFFCFSKVVSVDHNKPIIVPVGQDSFQQIGERQEGKLLV